MRPPENPAFAPVSAPAATLKRLERLGIRRIVSIDADFDVYRDTRGKPLTNLLRA